MTYQELRKLQSARFSEFQGVFFAFSNEQFAEGMAKLGLGSDEGRKILSIGAGGYLLRDKMPEFDALLEQNKRELAELKADNERLLEALVHELNNHEFCYTGDPEDALDALGMKIEDVPADLLSDAMSQCYSEE